MIVLLAKSISNATLSWGSVCELLFNGLRMLIERIALWIELWITMWTEITKRMNTNVLMCWFCIQHTTFPSASIHQSDSKPINQCNPFFKHIGLSDTTIYKTTNPKNCQNQTKWINGRFVQKKICLKSYPKKAWTDRSERVGILTRWVSQPILFETKNPMHLELSHEENKYPNRPQMKPLAKFSKIDKEKIYLFNWFHLWGLLVNLY